VVLAQDDALFASLEYRKNTSAKAGQVQGGIQTLGHIVSG
jgi:hypothetical protein